MSSVYEAFTDFVGELEDDSQLNVLVQQAGGRLVRSETDHGVLMLIDDRYLQFFYQRLLPGNGATIRCC
ncbi:hypothetical protein LJR153_007198 [Paenibacillus sp. LjRoot153]|uniref:helicase C-terminal domain-containing protein n=1 Tax=Paenibacillus sp. LjRoot153 TaxID=3342270 RepID=UPI003ED05CFE